MPVCYRISFYCVSHSSEIAGRHWSTRRSLFESPHVRAHSRTLVLWPRISTQAWIQMRFVGHKHNGWENLSSCGRGSPKPAHRRLTDVFQMYEIIKSYHTVCFYLNQPPEVSRANFKNKPACLGPCRGGRSFGATQGETQTHVPPWSTQLQSCFQCSWK